MIERTIKSRILSYSTQYPIITLTGPRQSGKTTLAKSLFPDKPYFSLEDLDIRNRIKNDPRTFLESTADRGAVLDEIQRAPDFLSYLQTFVDRHDQAGQFILTGSQNFELLNTVSQTLAGRTALATLLPFSYEEIYGHTPKPISEILFKGFYPRIHDKKLNPTEALSFYVSTYLERDIRNLIHVKDLSKFELFIKLCAARTGQILNLSNLSNDCGITHNTAKSWISVLQTSFVIHLLQPHHKNFRKRLIKSPKLYFVDVGLASYLLEINNEEQLQNHPLKGALFETFVVMEVLKHRFNHGNRSNLYYFRDSLGNEVDLLLDYGTRTLPIEIKLGATIGEVFFKGLRYYQKLNPKNSDKAILIYGGKEQQDRSDATIVSYSNIASTLEEKS